uniref:RWD domain-containing protein n=2 Tax=Clytia hemisphaerica TaxID=252671 RepID=A0A7M5V733_9CNID|eukprot:TCONS_00057792-protein
MTENQESQKDEIEALTSIYGKDFSLLGENTFDLRICCDDIKWWAVTVSVLLPENYPSEEAPLYEIHTECLAGSELGELQNELDNIWQENIGTNVLYMWTEKIREYLFERYERAKLFIESPEEDKQRERALTDLMREEDASEQIETQDVPQKEEETSTQVMDETVPEIHSSDTITLKKSTFQGHSAVVHTLTDISEVKHTRIITTTDEKCIRLVKIRNLIG